MSDDPRMDDWATHVPALAACLAATNGPVLEVGAGIWSTPILHAACAPTRRHLLTMEGKPEWLARFLTMALLSRDAVRIIRAALDRPISISGECEDVFMGQALHAAGVAVTPGAQRFDYWASERRGPLPDVYHTRCKGLGPGGARRDLEAFADIHRMKLAKVSG